MKTWCEHLNKQIELPPLWTHCPYCGKPRPEEPKELWELMQLSWDKPKGDDWQLMADTAKAWFIERMKSDYVTRHHNHQFVVDGIKRAINFEDKS